MTTNKKLTQQKTWYYVEGWSTIQNNSISYFAAEYNEEDALNGYINKWDKFHNAIDLKVFKAGLKQNNEEHPMAPKETLDYSIELTKKHKKEKSIKSSSNLNLEYMYNLIKIANEILSDSEMEKFLKLLFRY